MSRSEFELVREFLPRRGRRGASGKKSSLNGPRYIFLEANRLSGPAPQRGWTWITTTFLGKPCLVSSFAFMLGLLGVLLSLSKASLGQFLTPLGGTLLYPRKSCRIISQVMECLGTYHLVPQPWIFHHGKKYSQIGSLRPHSVFTIRKKK